MFTLKNKTDASSFVCIAADALLTAVNTHIDHASDPNCRAVEIFMRHLDDGGDMTSGALSLGAALEHQIKAPASVRGHSASIALVQLLVLAMTSPVIAQHISTPSCRGLEH